MILAIASGRGGLGKTSVAAAIAKLASRSIVCDLDVDAADRHILLQPQALDAHDFYAGQTAVLDADARWRRSRAAAARFSSHAGATQQME